jgi:hypothetical protein
MSKDKYGLFRRRRTEVPASSFPCRPLDSYRLRKAPKPEVASNYVVVSPQLTSEAYSPPTLPPVVEGLRLHHTETPVVKQIAKVATSASAFFNNLVGLASKPFIRIPAPKPKAAAYAKAVPKAVAYAKAVPVPKLVAAPPPAPVVYAEPAPEPLPGSREAKLRKFIATHF